MHPYRNPLTTPTTQPRARRALDPTLPCCFLVIGLSRGLEALAARELRPDAVIGLVVAIISAMVLSRSWGALRAS